MVLPSLFFITENLPKTKTTKTNQKPLASSSEMHHRSTAGNKSINRLLKEYKKLEEEPLELIDVCPDPIDMYKLHFVIHGAPDTPYFGGFYYGMLTFPVEYPLRPPSIMMFTPSGRFSTNTRLCLSMSDCKIKSN